MPKQFEKKFISYCENQDLEVNSNQIIIIKIEKISSSLVSEPFIFNNNLYVIRNGSVVQYN